MLLLLLIVKREENFIGESHKIKVFKKLNKNLYNAPVLALFNFEKVFEVESDASNTGIGDVLMQEGNLIEFFSENLNKARQKWRKYR